MLTLIIHGADDPGAVFAEVMRLAGQDGDPATGAAWTTLRAAWPPQGFMLEARARCRGGWLPWWASAYWPRRCWPSW